jgi:chromosomal replication initiator protein
MQEAWQEVWQEVLRIVRLKVRAAEFRNWFKPLVPLDLKGSRLSLRVRDGEFQSWFMEHHEPILLETLEKVLDRPVTIDYKLLDPELFDHVREEAPARSSHFPEDFSFDQFVVGPSNHMAYAACRAVAEKPGRSYNPLFIYGGTGLGKTHLLYAVGNAARRRNPKLRVLYISSETYKNDFVAYLRLGNMDQFRTKYRDACDILLVDDIHFLKGEETQTQFFHTFNALHAAGKQIVFTSDRPPQELPNIEERLRSRFEWGLIADINPPELETRVAILKQKAEKMGMDFPDDVAGLVADRVRDNIRELESCLKTLHLATTTERSQVTPQMAQEYLKVYFRNRVRHTTIEQVQKAVALKSGVSVADLTSQCRKKTFARPRHVAMYLSRKLTSASFPEIGEKFGGRDHSSVMSGIRNIERLLPLDTTLRQLVEDLEQRFNR